jgi:hypothetical protein
MDPCDGQSDAPPRDPPEQVGSASGRWEGYTGIAARAAGHGRDARTSEEMRRYYEQRGHTLFRVGSQWMFGSGNL